MGMFLDNWEAIRVGVLVLSVVVLLVLTSVNFGFDIHALGGWVLNRINIARYLKRHHCNVLRVDDRTTPLTATTTKLELAALLSNRLGVVFTPGDFSQLRLTESPAGLTLFIEFAWHSRVFYGRASVTIVQHLTIRTDSIITNTSLDGLLIP